MAGCDTPSSFPDRFKDYLFAFLLYTACTLLFFLPSLGSLSGSLIGPPEDNMQFYWFIWHGADTLLKNPTALMHSSLIYYPEGVSLFYANYFYDGILITCLLKPFFSLPLIFNLLVLQSFIGAGVAFFALARYVTKDFLASLVAGFVFAFNPSHFAHSLHHVTIASIQFIPLFVLFFMKALKEEKISFALLSALFLITSALCDWNYLVFGLVFIFLSYVYLALRAKKLILTGALKMIAILLFSTGLALSPLIVPMVWLGLTSTFKRRLDGHDIYVADAAGFFVPHVYHLLSHLAPIQTLNEKMTGTDWEKTVYLGWANLTLIGVALHRSFKKNLSYFLGLFACMILAMGSHPHVIGNMLPVVFPYKILEITPLLTQARNPSRIIVFAYLFLALLTALSLKELLRGPKRASKICAMVFVPFLFLDFYSVSNEMTRVELPKAYEAIVGDTSRDFGILELPWDGARYMMYQSIHGIAGVQGYIGRRIENTLGNMLDYNDLHKQKEALIENKVKYIVIHKKKMDWNPKKARDIRYFLTLNNTCRAYADVYEKVFEDDDSATFKVYK